MHLEAQQNRRSYPIFKKGLRCLGLLAILLYGLSFNAHSTHIVGGEINYRCLGDNDFEIYMTVYRDCINGVPYFDDPASLGIFNANDMLIADLRMPVLADDTIPGILEDPCFVDPPLACVHRSTYLDTIKLPYSPGGYQFAYQRCCRNGTIANIIEPDSTGITLYTTITDAGLIECNNSGIFREWPPIYICAGLPIVFDHGMDDADGDSIVYEMCAPFDGAMSYGNYNCAPQPCGVRPQPPFNPAYDSVAWVPGYGTNNMLGGQPPLEIDLHTGLLTATPCCIGQYVVGICAYEYRNGVLISTTKRDFQYNVGNCQLKYVSSFFTPEIVCTNDIFDVSFNNMSYGAGQYFWDFGDPLSTSDTSNLTQPNYVYADTGSYTVMLVAGLGTLCADTSYQDINLQYESINVDFTLDYEQCQDSIVIDFIDVSTDSISTIVDWDWDFGNGTTSSDQYPVIGYPDPGTYTIQLTVTAENGCMGTASALVQFGIPQISSQDSLIICTGNGPVELNPGGNPGHQYEWSPAAGLSSTTDFNPIAFPSETTTYTAVVSTINQFDTCSVEQIIKVIVPPLLSVDAGQDTISCSRDVYLEAQVTNASTVLWSDAPDFTNIINVGGSAGVLVSPSTSQTYYVQAYDAYGCMVEDEVIAGSISVDIEAEPAILICLPDSVNLSVSNLDPIDNVIYNWEPASGIISGANGTNPLVAPSVSTTYWVYASNQFGCADSAAVFVDVSSETPPLDVGVDQDYIYPGETVQLSSTEDPDYTYEWETNPILSVEDIPDPTAMVLEETTFVLSIYDEYGCENYDSVRVVVRPFICGDPYIFVPNAFTPNGDGANDVFYVRGNAITDLYFAVYSRWGELMFESTSLDDGWDGTFKGRTLSPDVYAYYLKLRCLDGEEYFKQGNVTLIR